MKKLLLAFALLLSAFCIPLAASDFGALFSSETQLRGNGADSMKPRFRESARLWFSTPFTNDNSVYLTAEGMYMYDYDKAGIGSMNILDVTLLKFRIDKRSASGGIFSLHAGRFAVSDVTGLVFSQTCDGVFVKAGGARCTVGLYGGYTGLLNAHDVTILVPAGSSYSADFTKLYPAAPGYIPLGITLDFPVLFANQKLVFQAWAFLDAMKEDFNRFYGEAEMSGPLGSVFSYKVSSVFGTYKFDEVTNLSQADIIFSPIYKIAIDTGFVYASGTQGIFTPFTGFTSETSSYALDEPEYTEMMKCSVSAVVTFTKDAQASLGAAYLFNCENTEYEIDGMQLNGDIIWNLLTNIQADASAYIFGAKDKTERNKAGGMFKISISF